MQTQCTTLQSMYIASTDAFQHDDAAQQEQRSGVTLHTVRERAEHNAQRLYDLTALCVNPRTTSTITLLDIAGALGVRSLVATEFNDPATPDCVVVGAIDYPAIIIGKTLWSADPHTDPELAATRDTALAHALGHINDHATRYQPMLPLEAYDNCVPRHVVDAYTDADMQDETRALADIAAHYGDSSPQHTDCTTLVAALQAEADRRGITLPAAVL